MTGISLDVPRAVEAAESMAAALGLTVNEAIVLQASNRLAVRLRPAEVLIRVATASHRAAAFEVDLAVRLRETDAPIAPLDPRVEPRVYERDGFAMTLWTYYPTRPHRELLPGNYAEGLARLHGGLRRIDIEAPNFRDRVQEARAIVANHSGPPELSDAERALLGMTLETVTGEIVERDPPEQLLHGEPHPGNVLNTEIGPLFIDLETCCRGPREFDLAHVPEAVSDRYPDVDQNLVRLCRGLVLAMVAAWRLEPGDQLPNGRRAYGEVVAALRAGPPYPALSAIPSLN
jgi:hypothetical protein